MTNLAPKGVSSYTTSGDTTARLVEEGALAKIGRGAYQTPNADFSEHQSLAEASVAAPRAIVALLSALRFHGLTTQNPHQVWMLIDGKARVPASPSVRVRFVRANGEALKMGFVATSVDGVRVRITNAAKTVADCFKYRRHVGIDVAIEALRDGLRRKVVFAR